MIVTGFMGSPRKKGNTSHLLKTFLSEMKNSGAETQIIHVPELKISPCTGCGLCEKKGICRFNDDMADKVFPLIRNSHLIVMAAPVYFYSVPAEMKAFIDRTQTLWSRKFKLGLKDPFEYMRKGFLLSVGATRGKDLFDGIHLTMKYFMRGISTEYTGGLTYWKTEEPGDMKKNQTLEQDVYKAVRSLINEFEKKQTWLVLSEKDNLAGPMACAILQNAEGNRVNVFSAGLNPAHELHPLLVPFMEKKGIDLYCRKPENHRSVSRILKPDKIITIGNIEVPDELSDIETVNLNISFRDAENDHDMEELESFIRKNCGSCFFIN